MDDAAHGLPPLSFQKCAVVALNDMDQHLAVTHLRKYTGVSQDLACGCMCAYVWLGITYIYIHDILYIRGC